MRIFKHRYFSRWAKNEQISDQDLKIAAQELEEGLFDANLGSGLYKKRMAHNTQGKRSAYRLLIAFKKNERIIFMFGFSKNECSNIGGVEQAIYKRLAKDYLNVNLADIEKLLKNAEFIEVKE